MDIKTAVITYSSDIDKSKTEIDTLQQEIQKLSADLKLKMDRLQLLMDENNKKQQKIDLLNMIEKEEV